MMKRLTSLALCSALLLSGCSGGTDEQNTQASQFRTLFDVYRASRQDEPQPARQLTPAFIQFKMHKKLVRITLRIVCYSVICNF